MSSTEKEIPLSTLVRRELAAICLDDCEKLSDIRPLAIYNDAKASGRRVKVELYDSLSTARIKRLRASLRKSPALKARGLTEIIVGGLQIILYFDDAKYETAKNLAAKLLLKALAIPDVEWDVITEEDDSTVVKELELGDYKLELTTSFDGDTVTIHRHKQ